MHLPWNVQTLYDWTQTTKIVFCPNRQAFCSPWGWDKQRYVLSSTAEQNQSWYVCVNASFSHKLPYEESLNATFVLVFAT